MKISYEVYKEILICKIMNTLHIGLPMKKRKLDLK